MKIKSSGNGYERLDEELRQEPEIGFENAESLGVLKPSRGSGSPCQATLNPALSCRVDPCFSPCSHPHPSPDCRNTVRHRAQQMAEHGSALGGNGLLRK